MVMEAVEAANKSRKRDLANVLPELRECLGKALCEECFWWDHNGGWCSGCDDDYQKRCLKRVCSYNCYDCGGGGHATTPGCCGRTTVLQHSWRERFNEILEYPIADYAPAPLQIQCRLIPVIYAQIGKFRIPEEFPQIDAWAVPIHKVADRNGKFRSNDLKDYLSLAPDRKLILNTCAPDDYQETLWEKGPQMEYEQYGIDYWFPGHFSIYDDDSKLYLFINAKRQQIHATWTKSHFVWFRLGENIPVEFLNPIRQVPSVLISTNQMYSQRNRNILLNEVKVADGWFPQETDFFIVGDHRWLSFSDKRKCFEINSRWLMLALKGRNLKDTSEPTLARKELLIHNLSEVIKNVR